ncbi:hypothetical protein KEF85_02335 [Methylomonas paludis]|uniref:Uncharacterized protein n=1 Tax=Methylomonas paludis TaxID=1173101 RepID=A0A975MNY3_9GAMM|nr:hypothetical protein [Methylomonas paludis]QWF71348.1 hypothetical protein KEF85_02335 [Methylomonas paludis]
MPQPFNERYKESRPIVRGGRDCLITRPDLAAHIANIAHMWTHIDVLFGVLLGVLTKSDASTSMMIYTSIVNNGTRFDILKKIVNSELNHDLIQQFAKIIKKYRQLSPSRNRIVHGMWAISDEKPDEIYLIDPNWHLNNLASWFGGEVVIKNKSKIEIDVYKINDFIDIQRNIIDFERLLNEFCSNSEIYINQVVIHDRIGN